MKLFALSHAGLVVIGFFVFVFVFALARVAVTGGSVHGGAVYTLLEHTSSQPPYMKLPLPQDCM